ncbi:MAG: hypothetical protein JNK76_23870 [Planctomycetales bacterium]|nr:hypothetical protein [Planctomycetales bacterium]MBN8626767.1 hypothetical protein [Planctomycetota bacterium]
MKTWAFVALMALSVPARISQADEPAANAPATRAPAATAAKAAADSKVEVVAPGTAAAAAPAANEDWRFVWKDGMWWYYMPDQSWMVHVDGGWQSYDTYAAAVVARAAAQTQAALQAQVARNEALQLQQYSQARRSTYYSNRSNYYSRPRMSVGIGVGSGALYLGSPGAYGPGYGYPYGYPYGSGYGSPYGYGGRYPYGMGGYPGYYGGNRSGFSIGFGF